MPDVDPDPDLPDPDNPPPDLPEPYRHPEGDPPERPPPEHEPPERQPPVHACSTQRRPMRPMREATECAVPLEARGDNRGWRASRDARAAAVVLTAVLGAACAQPGRGGGPLPRAADRPGGEGGASAPVAPRVAASPSGALSPTDALPLPVSGAMTRTHGALCAARQA
ncbi:hypothetical protein [Burkholderia sp. TSV86]|uniref:hypothetical protein n=1 Tax=Burkholderia sp. TSV86 TaxID=1385594 RepID=UPI0018D24021|nr:hypothetical protein [Burkholderia sp. TSV86]